MPDASPERTEYRVEPYFWSGSRTLLDSGAISWNRRAGVFLAIRYLRRHSVPVVTESLDQLPRLSKRAIRLALRLFPNFLDRADMSFPVIIAGRGWYQVALDGRHRICKAIWTGRPNLPAVRVPFWHVFELVFPGVFEVEWLFLYLRHEHRKPGRLTDIPPA